MPRRGAVPHKSSLVVHYLASARNGGWATISMLLGAVVHQTKGLPLHRNPSKSLLLRNGLNHRSRPEGRPQESRRTRLASTPVSFHKLPAVLVDQLPHATQNKESGATAPRICSGNRLRTFAYRVYAGAKSHQLLPIPQWIDLCA